MSWTGTVRCSYCGDEGHNRRSCPDMIAYAKENPHSWVAEEVNLNKKKGKNRRCSYCKLPGHNKKTCDEMKFALHLIEELDRRFVNEIIEVMRENSIGPGAILLYESWDYNPAFIIDKISWERVSIIGEKMGMSLCEPWKSMTLKRISRNETRKHLYGLIQFLRGMKYMEPHERIGEKVTAVGLAPKIAERYFRNLKFKPNKGLYGRFAGHYGKSGCEYFFERNGISPTELNDLREEYQNAKNNT